MFRHNDHRACCRSLFTQLPELVAEMTAADGVALCAQLVGMRSDSNVAACAALTLAKVLILRLLKPCKPFSELVGCAQTTTSPPSPGGSSPRCTSLAELVNTPVYLACQVAGLRLDYNPCLLCQADPRQGAFNVNDTLTAIRELVDARNTTSPPPLR